MPTIISNIIFSVAIATLVIYVAKLKIDKAKISKVLIKTSVDLMIVRDELEKARASNENQSVEQTDGFLKFITESRNWAFEYIEEVQDGLKKFSDKVGPTIKYLNTYGSTVSTPHDDSIKTISEAYKELEELLPKDE